MYGKCLPFTGDTPNTTRLSGMDQYQLFVAVSEAVWANPAAPMPQPGVVILARGDGLHYQDALISSSLIHFPRNGPVLLTEPDRLNPLAKCEILRLDPTGGGAPAQVFTVGGLSAEIDAEVRAMGYTVFRVDAGDPAGTAVLVWDLLGPRRNVMVVSGERFPEALPAGGWAAHMGDPILLTCQDQLPRPTAEAIRRRRPNVYIVGGEATVSRSVEKELRRLTPGRVRRIGGADPYEVAVNFARYRSPRGDFGWDVNSKRGWSFRFARYDTWYGALAGNPLSHLGKHSPSLLVRPQAVPPVVEEYILDVNPRHMEPEPPYMHGFIVGGVRDVNCPVQWRLDELLETVVGHH